MTKYIIPLFILFVIIFAIIKKVKIYDAFTTGIGGVFPLIKSLFPFLVAIFILTELSDKSGLTDFLTKIISPITTFFGIPKELTKLILIKPFSGSGALATVSEIYEKFGADSYIARCASVIYGSSETVFYIAGVYFIGAKKRNLLLPILISLFASFISFVFACFICKIL